MRGENKRPYQGRTPSGKTEQTELTLNQKYKELEKTSDTLEKAMKSAKNAVFESLFRVEKRTDGKGSLAIMNDDMKKLVVPKTNCEVSPEQIEDTLHPVHHMERLLPRHTFYPVDLYHKKAEKAGSTAGYYVAEHESREGTLLQIPSADKDAFIYEFKRDNRWQVTRRDGNCKPSSSFSGILSHLARSLALVSAAKRTQDFFGPPMVMHQDEHATITYVSVHNAPHKDGTKMTETWVVVMKGVGAKGRAKKGDGASNHVQEEVARQMAISRYLCREQEKFFGVSLQGMKDHNIQRISESPWDKLVHDTDSVLHTFRTVVTSSFGITSGKVWGKTIWPMKEHTSERFQTRDVMYLKRVLLEIKDHGLTRDQRELADLVLDKQVEWTGVDDTIYLTFHQTIKDLLPRYSSHVSLT